MKRLIVYQEIVEYITTIFVLPKSYPQSVFVYTQNAPIHASKNAPFTGRLLLVASLA